MTINWFVVSKLIRSFAYTVDYSLGSHVDAKITFIDC